jgi:hypothetical protein
MKQAIMKFAVVPSSRRLFVGLAGTSLALGASASFADDLGVAASAAITAAQASGLGVGGSVVACVAALCVVGVIISLVRKV